MTINFDILTRQLSDKQGLPVLRIAYKRGDAVVLKIGVSGETELIPSVASVSFSARLAPPAFASSTPEPPDTYLPLVSVDAPISSSGFAILYPQSQTERIDTALKLGTTSSLPYINMLAEVVAHDSSGKHVASVTLPLIIEDNISRSVNPGQQQSDPFIKNWTYRGVVASFENLPTSPRVGDAYAITKDGTGHVWNGNAWDNIGAYRGERGYQGIQGIQGIQGVKGDQGIASSDIYYPTITNNDLYVSLRDGIYEIDVFFQTYAYTPGETIVPASIFPVVWGIGQVIYYAVGGTHIVYLEADLRGNATEIVEGTHHYHAVACLNSSSFGMSFVPGLRPISAVFRRIGNFAT